MLNWGLAAVILRLDSWNQHTAMACEPLSLLTTSLAPLGIGTSPNYYFCRSVLRIVRLKWESLYGFLGEDPNARYLVSPINLRWL